MARFSMAGVMAGLIAGVAAGVYSAGPAKERLEIWAPALAQWFGGAPRPAAAPPARPTPSVKVARVASELFSDRVEALGNLRANETVALTAPVTDIVAAIRFEDGQRVEKGDILVEMVSSEEKAMRTEFASSVNEAKSQYDRTKELAQRKIATDSLLDQRRREIETADARLKAIDARLADRVVRAPFSGVMGLRNISVGAMLDPSRPFARIEDDSVMKLDFSVPSTFLDVLKPGLAIKARASGGGSEDFDGSVTSIDNAVDEITRTIRVRALIPNTARKLKPGLLMSIDLLKNPRQALVVPEAAIVPAGTDSFVFVVDEAAKKAERRKVVTGGRRAGTVEIREGLKAGELVVTDGTMKIGPGSPVIIQSIDERTPAAQSETPSAPGSKT